MNIAQGLGLFENKLTLNPYQPRPPLQYELMTDEELIEHSGSEMIFDTETFANYFLAAFKHVKTGKVVLFEIPFEQEKLRWLLSHYTCIGFYSLKYDVPLVWLAYITQDMNLLKAASNDLIHGLRVNEVQSKYRFKIYPTNNIDLVEVCPLTGSLKLYGARLHAKRIQDVPWANEQELKDWQIPVTRDYCINDLDTTQLLYDNLTEQLDLRRQLSKEYGSDMMSKSDAQIAEAVIGNEIKRLRGRFPPRPKIQAGMVHRFIKPDNMTFYTEQLQDVLTTIQAAEFRVADTGYLICPREIEELKIEIGQSIYRMGIGGLHSSEKNMVAIADDLYEIVDRDVASYYPAILINCGFIPKRLGEDFLIIYKALVERRLDAKKRKDLAVSENLKITINGTFGKTASPYSILYAPELLLQITVCGQLYLLMLIEQLELSGIQVISANTDGLIMKLAKDKSDVAARVIADWEGITGFVTEETKYCAIYARDVNAYLAVKHDGEVKGKNIFYDPWRSKNAKDAYWRFQKNPNCQICVEAVELFIVKGIDIRETICNCTDITKFVAIKNVTGGAHQDGDYLGKVIRWYMSIDAYKTINYISNNHLVPDTQGARPLMDLPNELPEDLDHDYYIDKAYEMLEDMGYRK